MIDSYSGWGKKRGMSRVALEVNRYMEIKVLLYNTGV